MKVYLGADHAGYEMKEKVKNFLENKGFDVEDFGTHSKEKVDYPHYGMAIAKKVARESDSRGILICGTGTGMAIAANRIKGARAVAAYDAYSAKMSRVDNDSNILALRGRKFSFAKIKKIMMVWFSTDFSYTVRHKRRIAKLDK